MADLAKAFVADDLRIVPPPTNPMAVARAFVREHHSTPTGISTIKHHRGDFYAWDGTCWPEAEERTVRARLYGWLEPAWYEKETQTGTKILPFEPNRRKLGDVVEAVAAIGHLPQRVEAPAWLDDGDVPAQELIVMSNGVLHLPTRTLRSHTPNLFTHHSLPFDYEPDAPVPAVWETFLRELWADDEEIAALAEIFGYVLSGRTNLQKIFALIGPKRSGKGTIARVLTGLLGSFNVTAPTLASLTQNFGLQDLIGKPLAVISDARLGSRTDGLVAVERLLSISGEDAITVDRKYKEHWTGKLPTRFVILTNEVPRFTDSSGALASRFNMLTTSQSFYGRENPQLTDQLLAVRSGIFNWALRGLDRLTERGYFVQPASSEAALRQLEDLSSPVGAFLRDRCVIGPEHEADKDDLYTAWKEWCASEGRDRSSTKAVFFRDLKAAAPAIKDVRPRDNGGRAHVYRGIGLGQQWGTPLTTPDHAGWSQDRSGVGGPETRRSSDVVRDGQGSSALSSHHANGKVRTALDQLFADRPEAHGWAPFRLSVVLSRTYGIDADPDDIEAALEA